MKSTNASQTLSAGIAPIYRDERGFFQELLHFNQDDETVAQISWFSTEPGKWRGGHMHKYTTETFIVLEGSVVFIEFNHSLAIRSHRIVQQSQIVQSRIDFYHAFYSDQFAKVLTLSNRHFNVNAPDTYLIEREKVEEYIRECVIKSS